MLTSLMAWAHGHHHLAGLGSLEHPAILHNLILMLTDLLTEMLVRPPMDSTEVQGILSLPVITAFGAIFIVYDHIFNSGIGSFLSDFVTRESRHALSLLW